MEVSMRKSIQQFGRSLSAMVMPNIGAFIAWGLITAMFIPGGWFPNEHLAIMVSPMLKYLLPTLIAFTAGKNISGYRGGVAGAVAAMGVIIGTDTPMFLGAMIMGPLAGWCIKKFDSMVKGKVGAGFEMLVDNFSLGIIALLLAIAGYLLIGGIVEGLSDALGAGVNWMLKHKLNPLLSLIVDPAKVVFLNNAVNHGIMTPLGIQQAAEMGHSMLFLVDPNPGPGLGILLACWVFGKGMTKQSAPGAAVIQLFGGIHEIYFPYVLARPMLLLPIMIGNVCALSFFTLTDFGLVAPASPGSLISIILMSPRGRTLIGILGVFIATAISFLLSIPIIKSRPDFQGESCVNSAVDAIPDDADLVVCQRTLADRVQGHEIVRITNFISDPALDSLLDRLKKGPEVLQIKNILTGLPSESKEEAILRAGHLLETAGYVDPGYAESMLEREKIVTTYIGMGLAIPHGTAETKALVRNSGIVVLQYPDGVDFGGEKARLVIGIAGVGDAHLDILAKISSSLDDEEVLERLSVTSDPEEIFKVLV